MHVCVCVCEWVPAGVCFGVCVSLSLGDGHGRDGAAVAGGDELRLLQAGVAEAVHLGRVRPNQQLLALAPHGDGGHRSLQLHTSGAPRGGKDQDDDGV